MRKKVFCVICVILAALLIGGCAMISVQDNKLISVSDDYVKEYIEGASFDAEHITVSCNGNVVSKDEYTLVENSSELIANPNCLIYTQKTYSVKYKDKLYNKDIKVKFFKPLTKASIVSSGNASAKYGVGDSFNNDDWRIKAWYSEEQSVLIPLSEEYVSGLPEVALEAKDYMIGLSILNISVEKALVFSVEKTNQNVPSLEVSYTNNSATAISVEGAEFKLNENGVWQEGNTFSNLSPNTQYTIYARMKETDKKYASEVASYRFTTQKKEIENIEAQVFDITDTSFKVKYVDGLVVSAGTLQITKIEDYFYFSNASPNTDYQLGYYISADETHYESDTKTKTVRTKKTAASFDVKNQVFEYNGGEKRILFGIKLADGQEISVTDSSVFSVVYKQNGKVVTPIHAGEYQATLSYTGKIYDIQNLESTLTITKKDLTVTADSKEVFYGDKEVALTYFDSGLIYGDKLTGELVRENGNDSGTYQILQGSLNNDDYNIVFVGADYKINKKSATVSVDDCARFYGDDNPAFSVTTEDVLDGDSLGNYAFSCSATKNSNVGTYDITLNGVSNDNYVFNIINGLLTVNKRHLTVTAENKQSVYGDSVDLTYTVNNLANSDSLSGSLACENITPGEWDITVGTLSASENYTLKFIGATHKIAKGNLTVAVKSNYEKTYGDINPAFEYLVSGYVYGENASVLNGDISVTCSATQYSKVGVYDIIIGGVTAENYEIKYMPKLLTIKQKTVIIKADAKSQEYGEAEVALTYTAEGLVNGDALYGALARKAGEDVGAYAIEKGKLFNENYIIEYVSAEYIITPATLIVTVRSVSKRFGEDNPENKYGYSATGFKKGEGVSVIDETSIAYITPVTKETAIGEYAITVTGLTAKNYTISVIDGMLQVTKNSINILVDDSLLNATYDGNAKQVTATAEEAGEFTFIYKYNNSDVAPIDVGTYTVKVIFGGDGNYEETSKLFTLNIIPRNITVTADKKEVVYGDSAELTYTYNLTNLLGNSFSGALTRVVGDSVGSYSITRGNLSLKNHNIIFVASDYIITPKTVKFTVTASEKQYGNGNPNFSYNVEGLINGDGYVGVASYETLADYNSVPAEYDVTMSGLSAGDNYKVEFVKGVLTVKKRNITLQYGINDFTYTGKAHKVDAVLSGIVNGDILNVSFDKELVNAGSYTVTASISSTKYILTGAVTKDITVKKAEQVFGEAKTAFEYTSAAQYFVASLSFGDGVLSYVGNGFTTVGAYSVKAIAGETANFKAAEKTFDIEVTKGNAVIESVETITIDFGTILADGLISGVGKTKNGALLEGSFRFKTQGLMPSAAQSGSFEIEFIPLDTNYLSATGFVSVVVNKITVNVTPTDGGKIVGMNDPKLNFTVTGEIEGSPADVKLIRESGETVGEYAYLLSTVSDENYDIALTGAAKFYIFNQLVSFNYSDAFKYRLGTVGGVALNISLSDGITADEIIYEKTVVEGNPDISFNGLNATAISGSGLIKVSLKLVGKFNIVFDEYIFEVVIGAKNINTLSGLQGSGNRILHSDILVTQTGFSVAENYWVYGNGYTVDARGINPSSNYQSVVTVQGLLENITIKGRYADTGYNSDEVAENNYKTVQTVYLYKNGILRNCHISGGRYAIRTGGLNNALIENSTIANAIYNIAVFATGGNEKLTLRNVDIVEKPTGNSGEGVGAGIVFMENKYPKNFTLRLEGEVNFHCFLSKNDISKMAGDYQTILNTLWSSANDFIYNIDGTDYLNVAIAHIMSDSDDFILSYADDCNIKTQLSTMEKSVTVMSVSYTGKLYSFNKSVLPTAEVNKLFAEPSSRAGRYSALMPEKGVSYKTDLSATIDYNTTYCFDRNAAEFIKYNTKLNYTTSISQVSVSVGGYTENAVSFILEMGIYRVTYKVYDHFDDCYFYYDTLVSVTDNTPAPVIVFAYCEGKGSGTIDDPLQWQGKTVGTVIDNDFDCFIDVYFGVQAYDGRGNRLPLTSFTIKCGSTEWSNMTSGVYNNKSNYESGNTDVKCFIYSVTDAYGKTTTTKRYVKVTSWSSLNGTPDNGVTPVVERITKNYTIEQKNVGEIIIKGAGRIVVCDGVNTYSFDSTSAASTLSNVSYTPNYSYEKSTVGLTHSVTAKIEFDYFYTFKCGNYEITTSVKIVDTYKFSVTCSNSNLPSKVEEKVSARISQLVSEKEAELKALKITAVKFDAEGVPQLQ